MINHRLPLILHSIAAVALLLCTTACSPTPREASPTPDAEPVQRWSGQVSDLRMTWTAEPGIDLVSGAAVVVRAYRESIELAELMGDQQYVYPGFDRAVAPDEPDSRKLSAWSLWPSLATPQKHPLVGTLKSHILFVDVSGRDVTSVLCFYTYTAAEEAVDGRFVSQARKVRGYEPGVFAYWVKMLAPELSSGGGLPPQKGPEAAPTADVFGDWRIVGALNSFAYFDGDLVHEWPTLHADVAACVDKAPDPPDRRAFLIDGEHPRSDFPALPASPGWPAESR